VLGDLFKEKEPILVYQDRMAAEELSLMHWMIMLSGKGFYRMRV